VPVCWAYALTPVKQAKVNKLLIINLLISHCLTIKNRRSLIWLGLLAFTAFINQHHKNSD